MPGSGVCLAQLASWLGGVQSYCPDLLAVDEHAGSLVGRPAVVGGGEDGKQVAMLLDLESVSVCVCGGGGWLCV